MYRRYCHSQRRYGRFPVQLESQLRLKVHHHIPYTLSRHNSPVYFVDEQKTHLAVVATRQDVECIAFEIGLE